jgi:hypothetical protein
MAGQAMTVIGVYAKHGCLLWYNGKSNLCRRRNVADIQKEYAMLLAASPFPTGTSATSASKSPATSTSTPTSRSGLPATLKENAVR